MLLGNYLLYMIMSFSVIACQCQEKTEATVSPELPEKPELQKGIPQEQLLQLDEGRPKPRVPNLTKGNYVGDKSICRQYKTQIPNYSETFDTLITNPLAHLKIKSELKIQRSLTDCERENEYYHAWEFRLEDGTQIQFVEDANEPEKPLLSWVNKELFSVKKMLGGMLKRKSRISFHYDTGKMFLLTNGNLLYKEQPATWCGLANQFDFYQYFDLKTKELVQFAEKDSFIEKLR